MHKVNVLQLACMWWNVTVVTKCQKRNMVLLQLLASNTLFLQTPFSELKVYFKAVRSQNHWRCKFACDNSLFVIIDSLVHTRGELPSQCRCIKNQPSLVSPPRKTYALPATLFRQVGVGCHPDFIDLTRTVSYFLTQPDLPGLTRHPYDPTRPTCRFWLPDARRTRFSGRDGSGRPVQHWYHRPRIRK